MAICKHCEKDMLVVDSCIELPIMVNDKEGFNPIPYGQETRFRGHVYNPENRCHDCNVKFGGFHHPGCDWEECPICHEQIISCYCHEEGEFTPEQIRIIRKCREEALRGETVPLRSLMK